MFQVMSGCIEKNIHEKEKYGEEPPASLIGLPEVFCVFIGVREEGPQ